MSAYQDLNAALAALKEKLDALQVMAEANKFLVQTLKDEGEALLGLEAEPARALIRKKARAKFGAKNGTQPDAAVLALLEQSLSSGLKADVIPFPAPRRLM